MKHLISAAGLSAEQVVQLLDTAEGFSTSQEKSSDRLNALKGKTVANLFFEDSTRTRVSFELAAKRLGADVVNISAKGSSVSKGESLKDTAQVLEAMGVNALVMRHHSSGAAARLVDSSWVGSNVINAGDGKHEHPTQALLDAFTIRKALHNNASSGKALTGVKVLIVGDVLHSRVARSNFFMLTTLGAEVRFCGSETLLPHRESMAASQYNDFDLAIAEFEPDVVMMLRVQLERMSSAFFPSPAEYAALWGLNDKRLNQLPTNSFVMHPGPMNRGLEIASDVADSERFLALDQVKNGILCRMSVLYHLMAQESAA